MLHYTIIFVLLLALEFLYFKLAEKYNIMSLPNERSSHSSRILCGGGIIFLFSVWVWSVLFNFPYPWFLIGVTLVGSVSFLDDIHPLPDSIRLVAQFIAMVLLAFELGIMHWNMWWIVLISLVIAVGMINVYNFMDGINGITCGYSLVVIAPLMYINMRDMRELNGFIDNSFIITTIIALLIFSFFNFRPEGKAKCFAGDVGSITIATIIVFLIGKLILYTGDLTYLLVTVLYGIDACMTICHRILLHENLGVAHRKHAFQIMANELKLGHVKVSLIYMGIQLGITAIYLFVIPATPLGHWLYLISVVVVLSLAYLLFMKKYYHLHEEYLRGVNTKDNRQNE